MPTRAREDDAVDVHSERLTLHPLTGPEARRVIDGTPGDTDRWASDYPFADELDVLVPFVARVGDGADLHPFTLYRLVERATGVAIGGLGFGGPPDDDGAVEIGYGLVPSARGQGYATEAVLLAVGIAARAGATRVDAGTDPTNLASQRVLARAGFVERGRTSGTVRFVRRCPSSARTESMRPASPPS